MTVQPIDDVSFDSFAAGGPRRLRRVEGPVPGPGHGRGRVRHRQCHADAWFYSGVRHELVA